MKYCIATMLAVLLGYLSVAFYTASFNMIDWTLDCRFVCVTFMWVNALVFNIVALETA